MCVSSLLASIRARSCVPQWACCAAAAIGVLHHTHFSSHQQGGMAAPGCSSHSPVAGAQSTEGWLHPALAQCFPESPTCHLLPPQMCAAALPLSHKMAAAVAPQPHPLCSTAHTSLWHRAQPRGEHSGSHTVFLHHFYGISSSQEHQKEGGAAGQTREGTSMCEKEKMAKKH